MPFSVNCSKKMMLLLMLMRISSIRRIGLCRWLRYVASPLYFICGYCAWNAWQGSDRVSYPECHKWMTGNLYEMWANKLEHTKIPMYTMHFLYMDLKNITWKSKVFIFCLHCMGQLIIFCVSRRQVPFYVLHFYVEELLYSLVSYDDMKWKIS